MSLIYGPTKQQNGTKCKKPINQQNKEMFCYFIPKQQNDFVNKIHILLTKPMGFLSNNKTTKQQNIILFILFQTTKYNKI